MHRCLQLALKGSGRVGTNPLVGAVLVHKDRIIGEGYHAQFGGPHAEVACINSIKPADLELLPQSTMYVSLEPCAHTGKTPPCADMLIEKGIRRVVVGSVDPYYMVSGKGIRKLLQAGVKVETGILEAECKALNRAFFHFQEKQRPLIILKWAQSADGFIAANAGRTAISSAATNRLVHRWRTESMGIMVGANTALFDNPRLNARYWPGPDPVRFVLDNNLRLPYSLHLFNGLQPTVVFNKLRSETHPNLRYCRLREEHSLVTCIVAEAAKMGLHSLLIEGGAQLLQTFLNEGIWDEARIITNTALKIGKGIAAPELRKGVLEHTSIIGTDLLQYYSNGTIRTGETVDAYTKYFPDQLFK